MKRAEQYQKQLYRAEEDRRQALATSEALTALWQKKFEKAQTENSDLRSEKFQEPSHPIHIHVVYMYNNYNNVHAQIGYMVSWK